MVHLYNVSSARRTLLILVGFQLLLWSVSAVGFLTHREAWQHVAPVPPEFGAEGGFAETLSHSFLLLCRI